MDEVKAPVPPDAWQCVWVSYDDEGFFSAPRTEAELRVYFEIAPGLVEQRQEGTTFENWVEECEHYGLLIPQRPDAPFLTLSWSRSDVAEILAGLILPDTDANIDAVISDGQTIDRLRDACTAAGHDVLLDGVERLAEADRLARHPVSVSLDAAFGSRSDVEVVPIEFINDLIEGGVQYWALTPGLFIHGYHHDGGVDVELRQLTDAGEDALDAIEDAWVGEPFTSGGREYNGSLESMAAALRDLWEDPDLCPAPRYMELAFGCPAEEYETPTIDPLLEAAEFSPSAIMRAEVAPGTVAATVPDVSGVPYEIPADVLSGLKDAVRAADRAGTIAPFASLTIAGWNQKLDDSLWALDFEVRNGVPPQLSDYLARDADGDGGLDLDAEADDMRCVAGGLSHDPGRADRGRDAR